MADRKRSDVPTPLSQFNASAATTTSSAYRKRSDIPTPVFQFNASADSSTSSADRKRSDIPTPLFQFNASADSSTSSADRKRSDIPTPLFQFNASAASSTSSADRKRSDIPTPLFQFNASAANSTSSADRKRSDIPTPLFQFNAAAFASSAATSTTPSYSSPTAQQMAYDDAWRVCNPDFKTPFTSLEDACERLLPYHVVADYEDEDDDQLLASDSTGQMLSRSQLWDNNLASKVADFNATFEKQVKAFNALTSYRTEEKMMIEQLLLQDERQALLQLRSEINSKQIMAAVEISQEDVPAADEETLVPSPEPNTTADEDLINQPTDDFLNDNETGSE